MAVRVITSAIIFVGSVAIGVAMFFFLLLALNGYPGRVAEYAFIVYILGGLLVSAAATLGGFLLSGFLERKEWRAFPNAALSCTAFVGLAFVLKIVVFFGAILVAEAIRNAR